MEKITQKKRKTVLDVGCGEGFFLKGLETMGWQISGTDYSIAGIKLHNPSIAKKIRIGSAENVLTELKKENMKFSHAIPENRLTWDYLIRLHKGFSASYVVLKVYESILTPEVSFSPFKELLYYLALLIKYYPKFKNAQEGNKLILHYHGWKIIAHHLWKYLIERNEKKKNIEKLYAELKKMNT
jgi:SAM-dependent methyltransferase